jgi:hypothetical protein
LLLLPPTTVVAEVSDGVDNIGAWNDNGAAGRTEDDNDDDDDDGGGTTGTEDGIVNDGCDGITGDNIDEVCACIIIASNAHASSSPPSAS